MKQEKTFSTTYIQESSATFVPLDYFQLWFGCAQTASPNNGGVDISQVKALGAI